MTRLNSTLILLFLAPALACARADVTTEDTRPRAARPTKSAPSGEQEVSIRPLLLVRHPSDVPSKEVLDRHASPADQLRRLARTDASLQVRTLALGLLAHYPEPKTEQVLLEVLGEAGVHPKLEAAALSALGGWDLSVREDLRRRLVVAVHADDPRVAHSAASVLGARLPAHADTIRLRDDDGLPAHVQAALRGKDDPR